MNNLRLAWRQMRRDLKAGDVRILLAALVLAVVAVTAVGFVTDRSERALLLQANQLLGGDAVVSSEQPFDGAIAEAAQAPGLQRTRTVDLNSMIRVGEGDTSRLKLGDLRALGEGFPLRGRYRIVGVDGVERDASGIPQPGTVWLSQAGATTLDARIGDAIVVGETSLTLAALVVKEPDAAFDYFDIAPKVFLNLDDLATTGLVQEGSRVSYRLVVAGAPAAVEQFIARARPALDRGQRIETIAGTRVEIRAALNRASRFLSLAALVSVVLAAIAVAMAARRHSQRHLSGSAVMRCLGAQQRTLVVIHVGELLMLGLLASTIGVAIAFGLQWVIGAWLAQTLELAIPAAGWRPAAQGYGLGLVVLLAFGAPPVLALRRVPALRVLRRDLDPTEPSAWLVALTGLAGLALLLWWQAGSVELASAMLLGLLGTFVALAALAWGLIIVVRKLRSRLRGSLRYGLANVSRRPGASIAQVTALGMGMMVLLLLTFVRTDLLDRWQATLASDAPNRFIINVQADQVGPVRALIAEQGIAAPTLFPMVRARLVSRNGAPVSSDNNANDGTGENEASAQDGAGREQGSRRRERSMFNLSMATTLREDNKVVAGTFWNASGTATPQLSVEDEFAKRMGWTLGDRIGFDIAGQPFSATITSLRSVEWTSFKPNFFVVASPGALEGFPASHITAVSVPPAADNFTAQLVARFPNVSVIDIGAVLAQVRATADQASLVVEVVFWFAFAAGLLVLMAAVSASQEERLLEGGVMRVLGGSRRQLRLAQASEFAVIGLLAGLTATIAASVLAWILATRVFELPWQTNWGMAFAGGGIGALAALLTGLLATRRVLDVAPSVTLRELDN